MGNGDGVSADAGRRSVPYHEFTTSFSPFLITHSNFPDDRTRYSPPIDIRRRSSSADYHPISVRRHFIGAPLFIACKCLNNFIIKTHIIILLSLRTVWQIYRYYLPIYTICSKYLFFQSFTDMLCHLNLIIICEQILTLISNSYKSVLQLLIINIVSWNVINKKKNLKHIPRSVVWP